MASSTHIRDIPVERIWSTRTQRSKRSRKLCLDHLEPRELFTTLIGVLTPGNAFIKLAPDSPYTFSTSTLNIDITETADILPLPSHGLLTLNQLPVSLNEMIPDASLPSLVYTPAAGYIGDDSFQWSVQRLDTTFTLQAHLKIGNILPTVSDSSAQLSATGTTTLTFQQFFPHFTDPNFSDGLGALEITSPPSHGTLAFSNGTPVLENVSFSPFTDLVYTPDNGYVGNDAFAWNGSDGTDFAATPATLTLSLVTNSDPALDMVINLPITFSTSFFTTHFSDVDPSAPLQQIDITSLPSHGALLLSGTPVTVNQTIASSDLSNLTYTPAHNFTGADSFHWIGSDGLRSAPAPAAFSLSISYPFVFSLGLNVIPQGIPQQIPLDHFGIAPSIDSVSLQTIKFTQLPLHGGLSIDGSPAALNQPYALTSASSIIYTPDPEFSGQDAFYWTGAADADDFTPNSVPTNLNVYPLVAHSFTRELKPNQSVTLRGFADFGAAFPGYQLITSILPDSGPFMTLQLVKITSIPSHGTLTSGGTPVSVNQVFTAQSCSLTYLPDPDFSGTDVFSWTGSAGADQPFAATPGTVTLSVVHPSLSSANGVVLSNGTFNVTLSGASAHLTAPLLAGDDVADEVEITKLPTNGQLLLSGKPLHVAQILSPTQFAALTYKAPRPFTTDSFNFNIADDSGFAPTDATFSFIASTTLLTVVANSTAISSKQKPTAANFTDFGTWAVSPNPAFQGDTRTFTLFNTGNAILNTSRLTFSGPAAKDFSFVNTAANLPLTPGESATLTIKFLPHAAGNRLATLTLPGTDAKHPFLLQLAGTGLAASTIHTAAPFVGGIVQAGTIHSGKGPAAFNGQILTVTYTGYLANGTVFDSSAAHASSRNGLTFRIDDDYAHNLPFLDKDQALSLERSNVDGEFIPGWEFGLQGVKAGESRTIVMNAAAAYGSAGIPNVIPANATLRFDIQCISVDTKPQLVVGIPETSDVFTPTIFLSPGQTTISAAAGSLLTLNSNQTSASQTYSYATLFTDKANGVSLANITVSGITQSGPNATDFSITRSGSNFTLTFHPTTAGARNATVHLHSNDPLHPDFTFAIQGRSGNAALALLAVK